jgi:hypothetical protein
MKRIIFVSMALIVFFSIIICEDALTWDDSVTHKDLSEYAVENSVLRTCKNETDLNCNYLKALGLNRGLDEVLVWLGKNWIVTKWLREGAEREDARSIAQLAVGYGRSFNHFHNPLKPWENAGLDDWVLLPPFHVTGESSLIWAQDSTKQATYTDLEGDWSWKKIREYYYTALTGEDSTGSVVAPDQAKKGEYFARTFKGLGHQMHLLQDMAVPDHVRNDAHPEDSMFGRSPFNGSAFFESWAKEKLRNVNELKSFASEPSFPEVSFDVSYTGLAPTTQLFDAEQYNGTNPSISLTQGLSEYTNANFFSDDTTFAAERYSADNGHYFPYPKRTSTDLQNYLAGTKPEETVVAEDGDSDTGIWISKIADGENISHIVRTGKLTKWYYNIFGEGELFYSSFYCDEKCHEDYAQKLIPRAVGYSAGLLDYFFRGKLNIILISRDTFKIANYSDEDIEGNLSSFKLYYDDINDNRYEIPLAFFDGSGNQYTDPAMVLSIPKQTAGSFTVKLLSPPANPKTTGKYMLVFKGRIGNEGAAPYDTQYAVAAELITPHFLTQVKIEGRTDIYEYDQSGNRLANLTENLPRGESYYNGIPNPVNSDFVLFHRNTGCFLGMNCLHMLNRSTGEVTNFNKYGTYWWSKDGTRIYKHGEYYDLQTGTWNTFDAGWCSVFVNYFGSFSPDESKTAFEGAYYDNSTGYDYQDILIMTNWQPSHIVDMNTRRVVSVNSDTCPDYVRDEDFNETKPDFHPYQEKILFTSNADGVFDAAYGDRVPYNIYVADMGTGEVQRLTDAPTGSMGYRQAIWSFDGESILMIGGDPSEIYIMPLDGGATEKITNEGLGHFYPKWTRLTP